MFGLEKLSNIVKSTVLVPEEAMEHGKEVRRSNEVGMSIPFSRYFAAAKKRMKASNPIAPNQADIVNWILWDRFTIAAGAAFAANYKFFTTPISATKTKQDTNMSQVMRLEDPQWMNVTHIGFHLNPNIDSVDLSAILNQYYLEFWVGQKIYSEGKVKNYPGGVGVTSNMITTVAATTLQTHNNGLPAVGNMHDLRLPAGIALAPDRITDGLIGINILQGQSFKVEMQGTAFVAAAAPAPGIIMECQLHGILSRGVQ